MTNDIKIASQERSILYPAPADWFGRARVIRVEYVAELHQIGGNPLPHWSLTGALWDGPTTKRDSDCCGMGAMGESLVQLIPELAPFEALHLSDSHGVPMHAVENGWYHLGFTRYRGWGDTKDEYGRELDQPATVARHFRITRDEAIELHDMLARSGAHDTGGVILKSTLAEWVDTQRERWQAESDAALETLRTVELPGRLMRWDGDGRVLEEA